MKTNVKFDLQQIVGLAQIALPIAQSIIELVRARKATVVRVDASGAEEELTAEDVAAHVSAAQAEALKLGDAEADRIEKRHSGDGAAVEEDGA